MWVKALGEHTFFLRGIQTDFFADRKIKFIFRDRDRIFQPFNVALSHFGCRLSGCALCFRFFFTTQDFLLEEISRNYEVSRIKSVGGAAQVRFASVFLGLMPSDLHQDHSSCDVTSLARTRLVEINPGS
jgi:hypothetical protein